MKFESIEIYGFKSFADKVTLEFPSGMTSIVGPNGNGKSNVVDAIRWVLGEQSPKLLRGKSMQDVIFNGTEKKRKMMSYCEVSLKFNNEGPNRLFKTLQFDQVVITRKLYRNGNSEYLINGTTALLRDIRTLIRETGLGREGYSIIGQGKIDEIINSKPENRRAIFEDAAGVLSSKMAKKEAEMNLKDYEIKKDQYNSLLQEVERNVNRLEKEAEAAKKFNEIQARLTYLEANSYVFQKDNNVAQKERIKSRIAGICEQIESSTNENKQYIEKFDALTEEQRLLDENLMKLNNEKTILAVKEESVKGRGNTLLERKDGLLQTREDYSRRLRELEEDREKNNADIREFYSKKLMEKEDIDEYQPQLDAAVNKQNSLMSDILAREQEIEGKTQEITKLLGSIGDIKENLGKITAERDSILERISEVNEEIASLQVQIDNYEGTRSTQEAVYLKAKKEKEQLNKTLESLTIEYENLRKELEQLREKGLDLQNRVSSQKYRISVLESYVNQHAGFSAAVQQLLKAADTNYEIKSRILGVVADVINVDEKYRTAIEMAIGTADQNAIIVNTDEDFKFLNAYLNENRVGRVKFLPISSYKTRELDPMYASVLHERGCLGVASRLIKYDSKFNTIISGLLGSTLIIDDINNAIFIAKKYNQKIRLVTLKGEVFETSGSRVGGSIAKTGVGLISQTSQLEEAKKNYEVDSKALAETKKIFDEKNQDYVDMAEQLKEYQSNAKTAGEKYGKESSIYESLVKAISDLQERKKGALDKKKELEHRFDTLDSAVKKVSKQNVDITGDRTDINDEAAKKREEFNQKKKEKEALDVEIANLRLKLEKSKLNLQHYTDELEKCESRKKIIDDNIQNCKNILSSNDENIKTTETRISSAVLSDEEKKRIKEIDMVIKQYQERKASVVEEIRKNDELRNAISSKLISLNDQKSKNEASLINIDERMANLELRIKEDYDLDYERALAYKDGEFKFEEAQTEIRSLKGQRAQLGPINLNSIDLLVSEKERYDRLNTEYQDLLSAEADCKKIIADLSKEILEKFTVEFNKINENFKEAFKEVFGGGSGELRIQEPEEGQDILDAGIDVYAQPPGKKVALLMQLSGGEKALTAIAILFAILRLRPMPFCVLDEIDSALDEGNVGVCAKYIKKFSSETQFIVITHRKPTMKVSDTLYGVVMQEQGVSKTFIATVEEAIKHSSETAERVEK